jgi:hypothetical protein
MIHYDPGTFMLTMGAIGTPSIGSEVTVVFPTASHTPAIAS